jgi:hypothetical protein
MLSDPLMPVCGTAGVVVRVMNGEVRFAIVEMMGMAECPSGKGVEFSTLKFSIKNSPSECPKRLSLTLATFSIRHLISVARLLVADLFGSLIA